jgi:hypothetical protein
MKLPATSYEVFGGGEENVREPKNLGIYITA